MNTNDIVLGRCYLARLSKAETPVRLERNHPDGGWIARSLEHGRKVRIKDALQLLGAYDKSAVRDIATEISPNRRSKITGTATRPPANPLMKSEHGSRATRGGLPRAKPNAVQRATRVVLVRLNLLDAAHKVLSETKKAMTTREIVAACIEKQYWTSDAATPWQTLNAALNRDLAANGNESRFVKKERGKFSVQ